eukprot:CAMPEP_0119493460 /NCGR_PEP_ID=MMETSP1344-20130328/17707_1 /TAXON_ID=236787 /ORGANISM="Florenciella parvula, Strain CCMP2471" /LENGTH=86 /DNA_ID=CAMNT_0007528889 /DNA_START=481 /DNA_END=739 /DNA_ORIENTATION=-
MCCGKNALSLAPAEARIMVSADAKGRAKARSRMATSGAGASLKPKQDVGAGGHYYWQSMNEPSDVPQAADPCGNAAAEKGQRGGKQ